MVKLPVFLLLRSFLGAFFTIMESKARSSRSSLSTRDHISDQVISEVGANDQDDVYVPDRR